MTRVFDIKQLTTVNPINDTCYDIISSNSVDLIRLRKRVILVKCKPFVVYFLSLNFCYSILAKTTIVANLFYFYFVYYLFSDFTVNAF